VNLDILVKHRFMDYLKNQSIKNKATIIYVSHIFDGLDNWYTHLIYIKKNREMITQTRQNIQANDKHKEVYSYLLHEFLKEEPDSEKEEDPKNIYNKNAGGYSHGILTELLL
jgi:CCR4-NOT complex subunit CAF16